MSLPTPRPSPSQPPLPSPHRHHHAFSAAPQLQISRRLLRRAATKRPLQLRPRDGRVGPAHRRWRGHTICARHRIPRGTGWAAVPLRRLRRLRSKPPHPVLLACESLRLSFAFRVRSLIAPQVPARRHGLDPHFVCSPFARVPLHFNIALSFGTQTSSYSHASPLSLCIYSSHWAPLL